MSQIIVQQDAMELQVLQCGSCGVFHAIPQTMHDKCVEEGGFWHCPNGHSRGYREGRRSREKREQEQLEAIASAERSANYQREQAERARRQLAAAKGAMTKMFNRAKNGVCPCCNRSFVQLAAHMATKHPSYALAVLEHDK